MTTRDNNSGQSPRHSNGTSRREAEAKQLLLSDPEKGRELYAELAEHHRTELVRAPERTGHAAAWLRCLRRAGAGWSDIEPVVEALVARFPDDERVRSSAAFLWLDLVRVRCADRDLDGAVRPLRDSLGALRHVTSPRFLAMSLLGALRAFGEAYGTVHPHNPEHSEPALAAVVDALRPIVEQWLAALPEHGDDGQSERGDRRRLPPRHMGWLVVRRLGRAAGAWEWVALTMPQAEDQGVRNEWIADAEVEALLRLDRTEEALARSRELRVVFPRAEGLARREAEALLVLGREEDAEHALLEAALSARSPWPWRRLAEHQDAKDRPDDAFASLGCALALHDPNEPGPIWRLHMQRARYLLETGDEPRAARELWLARDARLQAGWGVGQDIHTFLAAHGPRLANVMADLDDAAATTVRRETLREYRDSLRDAMQARAVAVRVEIVRGSFALAREVDGERRVFISRDLLRSLGDLEPGTPLRVATIDSVDPKTGKPGFRAVWAERTEAGQRKGAASTSRRRASRPARSAP